MATILAHPGIQGLLTRKIECPCGCVFELAAEDIKPHKSSVPSFLSFAIKKADFVFECPACSKKTFLYSS